MQWPGRSGFSDHPVLRHLYRAERALIALTGAPRQAVCAAFVLVRFIPGWIVSIPDFRRMAEKLHKEKNVITEGVEELLKDTALEGLCHSVGMVIREQRIVRRDPVTNQLKMECSTQEVYYISDWDDRLSAHEFAGYVRDHWAGCEMIHYVLDTTFSEDLCRVRKGFSKQNYALLRRLIYAMLTWLKKTIHYTKGYAILRQSLRDTCGCIMINNNEGSCASEGQHKAAS